MGTEGVATTGAPKMEAARAVGRVLAVAVTEAGAVGMVAKVGTQSSMGTDGGAHPWEVGAVLMALQR